MTSPINNAVIRIISKKADFGIFAVMDLLSYDWHDFMRKLGRNDRNEAMVVYQFLLGAKDEYDDGYWDGGNDEDLRRRILLFLENIRDT